MTPDDATTMQEFVNRAWNEHGDDAEGVLERLPVAIDRVEQADDVPALAALIVHVAGEHLGRWADGIALLDRLAGLEVCDLDAPPGKAVLRSLAVLHLCAGDEAVAEEFLARGHPGGDAPEASTRTRVLAIATSALAGRGRTDEAIARFEQAVDLASYGPGANDPAARALAITGNNLACELEEKSDRTDDEDRLLERAALTARRFWEVAGTWVNVKIAEYRLCMTHLALGRPDVALAHAEESLRICDANDAGPGDRFFCHEALARARRAGGDAPGAAAARDEAAACLDGVDEGMREYAREALGKLDATLAGG